jgi:hypothetical protein
MAKYYGILGFVEEVETTPGVWESQETLRSYSGDVQRFMSRATAPDKVNDDIRMNNQISIIGDAYAYNHFYTLRFAEWCGARWKIESVEVQHPRLILTLGGLYNGD